MRASRPSTESAFRTLLMYIFGCAGTEGPAPLRFTILSARSTAVTARVSVCCHSDAGRPSSICSSARLCSQTPTSASRLAARRWLARSSCFRSAVRRSRQISLFSSSSSSSACSFPAEVPRRCSKSVPPQDFLPSAVEAMAASSLSLPFRRSCTSRCRPVRFLRSHQLNQRKCSVHAHRIFLCSQVCTLHRVALRCQSNRHVCRHSLVC